MSDTLKEKQRKSMVARRVMETRKAKGLSQYELAKLLECSQGLISQYEAGTANIALDVIIDMADVLGCSIDYLLGRDAQYDSSSRGRLYKAFERMTTDKQGMAVVMLEAAAELVGI